MGLLKGRRPLCLLLLVIGAGGVRPAMAAGEVVGEVVRVAPRVERRSGGGPLEPVRQSDKVHQGMELLTRRKAGARIAVNTGHPEQRGAVIMGPNTRVEFSEFVVDRATGIPTRMSWRLQLGQFQAAFLPDRPGQPREGEYVIVTPTAQSIRLVGTDVYVWVPDRRTTYVFVLEGEVTVEGKAGGVVRVAAGEWTQVAEGAPPTPPAPGAPGSGAPPRDLRSPDQGLLADPPLLDLRNLVDLPK